MSLEEATKLRLAQWGNVWRQVHRGEAPNPNYYSQQPFMHERLDHDSLRQHMDRSDMLDRAEQTHGWLMEMAEASPRLFAAVGVQYVEREPGTGRALEGKEKVRLWKKRTGLGKTRFYESLMNAERYIALRLQAEGTFR